MYLHCFVHGEVPRLPQWYARSIQGARDVPHFVGVWGWGGGGSNLDVADPISGRRPDRLTKPDASPARRKRASEQRSPVVGVNTGQRPQTGLLVPLSLNRRIWGFPPRRSPKSVRVAVDTTSPRIARQREIVKSWGVKVPLGGGTPAADGNSTSSHPPNGSGTPPTNQMVSGKATIGLARRTLRPTLGHKCLRIQLNRNRMR